MNYKAIQAFYKFKSYLKPEFIKKHKRTLNLLESILLKNF